MPGHCIECNACCKGLTVFLAEDDFLRVSQEWIDFTHGRPHLRQLADHVRSCSALDPVTGRCRIYATRPARCRQFSEESPRCLSWRCGKKRVA